MLLLKILNFRNSFWTTWKMPNDHWSIISLLMPTFFFFFFFVMGLNSCDNNHGEGISHLLLPKKGPLALWNVSKVACFCIPKSFIGENFMIQIIVGENSIIQNFNYFFHIFSVSKLNLFLYKKKFPSSKNR